MGVVHLPFTSVIYMGVLSAVSYSDPGLKRITSEEGGVGVSLASKDGLRGGNGRMEEKQIQNHMECLCSCSRNSGGNQRKSSHIGLVSSPGHLFWIDPIYEDDEGESCLGLFSKRASEIGLLYDKLLSHGPKEKTC